MVKFDRIYQAKFRQKKEMTEDIKQVNILLPQGGIFSKDKYNPLPQISFEDFNAYLRILFREEDLEAVYYELIEYAYARRMNKNLFNDDKSPVITP